MQEHQLELHREALFKKKDSNLKAYEYISGNKTLDRQFSQKFTIYKKEKQHTFRELKLTDQMFKNTVKLILNSYITTKDTWQIDFTILSKSHKLRDTDT